MGNEILQNEITRTQTSFSTNFGGKLSFIPSFLLLSAYSATTYHNTLVVLEVQYQIFNLF
jgi:hypothetical protein